MPIRMDADRWGDLEILDVAAVDLPQDAVSPDAAWWCGRCGDEHVLAGGSVVKVRSHLGVTKHIACERCAGIARRRARGTRPMRVLLIDDNADYRDLVRRVLERHATAEVVGYVGDGRQALVEIARLQPDLVVLDLAMPRLDGVRLLPRLPEDLEVIILSGFPQMRQRCQGLRRGVTVLTKDRHGLDRLVDMFSRRREPPAPPR